MEADIAASNEHESDSENHCQHTSYPKQAYDKTRIYKSRSRGTSSPMTSSCKGTRMSSPAESSCTCSGIQSTFLVSHILSAVSLTALVALVPLTPHASLLLSASLVHLV